MYCGRCTIVDYGRWYYEHGRCTMYIVHGCRSLWKKVSRLSPHWTILKHMFTNNEVGSNSKVHFFIDNLRMIINVKAINGGETWYKELTINNIKVAFKIDTDTNINVLPIKFINKNIKQKIEQKIIKLYAFEGTYIKVIGKEVNLNYKIIIKND